MKQVAVLLLALLAGVYGQVTVDTTLFVNQTGIIGNTASWTCTVSGTQSSLQAMVFSKINTDGTVTALTSDSTTTDATKYTVTGKYTLNILTVALTDEGGYTCSIANLGVSATAYLTAGVAPSNTTLSTESVQENTASTLTCASTSSRPPASFRWFNGATQVTTGVTTTTGTVDANGQAAASSNYTFTPAATDLGNNITCLINLGDSLYDTKSFIVAWSGAGSVLASVSLVLAALFASLQ